MPDSIVQTPVTVPANFVGTHTGDTLAPDSDFLCYTVRNWDYNGSYGYLTGTCVMTFINPSAGVYNWNTFDQLFSNNTSKEIVFCLGAVPDYLVSRAATGSSYKGTKGNMCPDDLAAWATAVKAVVSRAKNTFGRTGLFWQLWNEIDQPASYNDTISLLGPYTKATVEAIREIDPTAIILGPPMAGADAPKLAVAVNYLTASDGAGGTVKDWLDGICVHYYNQSASQINQFENPINHAQNYLNFQGAAASVGARQPIYITETGVISANPNGGRAYQRRLLTFAALGARRCLTYQYGSSLYPMVAYKSQINDVTQKLRAGAVISSCVLGMASMEITIDGVTYTY